MALTRLRVNELSSFTITATILDQASQPVPLSDITVATLTLFDLETYNPSGSPIVGIINSRDAQDVLNANNVTIHATSGLLTWVMQPADNPIVTTRRQIERHRAELHVEFVSGEFNAEWEIEVLNLRKAA